MEIRTERLVLRRMTIEDVPDLHACMSDPEVMRFWSTPPHASLEATRSWVEQAMASVAAGTGDEFAVVRNGRVIGKAGLWNGAEIGYFLHRDAWGLGLAQEALRAVVTRAFTRGVSVVTADIDPRNTRSLRLLLGLGFAATGAALATAEVAGTWVDSLYLALPAPRGAAILPSS